MPPATAARDFRPHTHGRVGESDLTRDDRAAPLLLCAADSGRVGGVLKLSHCERDPVGCIYWISCGDGFVFVDESAEQVGRRIAVGVGSPCVEARLLGSGVCRSSALCGRRSL